MNDASAQRVIEFIQTELLEEEVSEPLNSDDSLLKRGSIDSLGIVRLLEFLESTFEVRIPAREVTIQNFGTVSAMLALIERKRNEQEE